MNFISDGAAKYCRSANTTNSCCNASFQNNFATFWCPSSFKGQGCVRGVWILRPQAPEPWSVVDNMNLGSLEVPQERKSAMFFATLFWREPDLQIYNRAQWSAIYVSYIYDLYIIIAMHSACGEFTPALLWQR